MLPIFPVSPVPAPLQRDIDWGENANLFDSGARQAATPFDKPFIIYTFNFQNWQQAKQQAFWAHYHSLKGRTSPFLFMDPYDHDTAANVVVNTGGGVTSFMLVTSLGWRVIAASGTIYITSALSGHMLQGTHWVLDQDTGIIVSSVTIPASDYWTASGAYFRKCAYSKQYSESSPLWQVYGGSIQFKETV